MIRSLSLWSDIKEIVIVVYISNELNQIKFMSYPNFEQSVLILVEMMWLLGGCYHLTNDRLT